MPFNIKKISHYLMFRKITTVISFKIESTFEEWVKIFDSKEVDLRHSEFDINPLFRDYVKMILKSYLYTSISRGKYSKVCLSK